MLEEQMDSFCAFMHTQTLEKTTCLRLVCERVRQIVQTKWGTGVSQSVTHSLSLTHPTPAYHACLSWLLCVLPFLFCFLCFGLHWPCTFWCFDMPS